MIEAPDENLNPEKANGGSTLMNEIESQTLQAELQLNSIASLQHLYEENDFDSVDELVAGGEAVLYLRVSTTRQMDTAADLDEDGNSIATQRQWSMRKARELGATVVREFVEPGQSAQTIDKRPEFKSLLAFINENPDVRYVIIYMRSRVFRNYIDAAVTKRHLKNKNVTLVSAKENFGEGHMGDAMEAITDVVNELQVRMSGEDISIKMAHKVERGGSVGRAKLGYLNTRKEYDGRLVNTIDVDPERAPLIKWAFEEYATNQHSVWQLASMLEDHGLVTRPSQKRPSKPLSASALAVILRDPYYTGAIRYKGKLFAGRHKPIISSETFLAVQEILDRRNRKGDRDQIHFHYLKGLLYCAACHEEGRTSRLLYTQAKGNGGTYEYFICAARQRGNCEVGLIRVEDLEKAVERAVAAERFASASLVAMREEVARAVHEFQNSDREAKAALRQQKKKLEAQEERLIDLAAEGDIVIDKLRDRLDHITHQKRAISEKLAQTEDRMQYGAEQVLAYVDLLESPGDLYSKVQESTRRDLLIAFFSSLRVYVLDEGVDIQADRTEVNETLHEWQSRHGAGNAHSPTKTKRASRISADGSRSSNTIGLNESKGLSNSLLVGLTGFEPATP
ncbi:MAG TPA: recombinase family protein [Pseudolysinimonas sp.]|nr:recombinase family protein [Pseudolysinimonas sp.]